MRTLNHLTLSLALSGFLSACGKQEPTVVEVPAPAPIEDVRVALEARFQRIETSLRRGDAKTALTEARRLVDDHRTDPRAWVQLAAVYQYAENGEEAEKAARGAVQFGPDRAESWIALGSALVLRKRTQEAIDALNKALAIQPESRAARFNLASAYVLNKNFEGAVSELDTLIKANPDDVELRFLVGTVHLNRGAAPDAKAAFEELVAIYPQHVRAQRALAGIAFDARDYKTAYERALIANRIDANDDATGHLLEASFYIVAAARLTCRAGDRPWPHEAIIEILEKIEREDELEGAATFIQLDEKFGANEELQTRIATLAGDCSKWR